MGTVPDLEDLHAGDYRDPVPGAVEHPKRPVAAVQLRPEPIPGFDDDAGLAGVMNVARCPG